MRNELACADGDKELEKMRPRNLTAICFSNVSFPMETIGGVARIPGLAFHGLPMAARPSSAADGRRTAVSARAHLPASRRWRRHRFSMRSRDADFASQAPPTVSTDPFHAFVESDGVIGNCRIGHAARHLSRHVGAVHFNARAMPMPSDKKNG